MQGKFKIAFTIDNLLSKVYPKLSTESLKKDIGNSWKKKKNTKTLLSYIM